MQNHLFDVVRSNKVRININQTYPLREVRRAPQIWNKKNCTVLIPD